MSNPTRLPCQTCAAYGIQTLTPRLATVRLVADEVMSCQPYPLCDGCLRELVHYRCATRSAARAMASYGETGDVELDGARI